MRDDPQEITDLIRAWVSAVRAGELEGVLSAHAEDIVMFDVPPPDNGVRGIDAYRVTWPPFFGWLRSGASFDIVELDVTAGDDVAYAWARLRCGTEDEFRKDPDNRLRLTIGLRTDGGAGSCPTSITRSRTRASEGDRVARRGAAFKGR